LLQQYGTVKSLYDFKSGPPWDLNDNPVSLRAKAFAMRHHALTLLTQSKIHGSFKNKHLNETRIASHSITHFADSLSTFQLTRRGEQATVNPDGVKVTLIAASAPAYAAVVQINSIFAETDSNALDRQRNACKNTILVAKEMTKLGDQYFPPVFCVALAPIYQFLISEVRRQDDKRNAHFDADISTLLHTPEQLKKCMPLESAVRGGHIWQDSAPI